jgi:hypothetical protein
MEKFSLHILKPPDSQTTVRNASEITRKLVRPKTQRVQGEKFFKKGFTETQNDPGGPIPTRFFRIFQNDSCKIVVEYKTSSKVI